MPCLLEWIYVLLELIYVLLGLFLWRFLVTHARGHVCVWERERLSHTHTHTQTNARVRERERFVWAVFAGGGGRGIMYVCVRLYISWARIPIETIQPAYRADRRQHWSSKTLENLHVCCWKHMRVHMRAHARDRERDDFYLKQWRLSNYLVFLSHHRSDWRNSADR